MQTAVRPRPPLLGWSRAQWIALVLLLAVLAGMLVVLLVIRDRNNPPRRMDRVKVETSIERALVRQFGEEAPFHVSCPTLSTDPVRAGFISDCTVGVGPVTRGLRVTQDDNRGHYTWQLTG